MYFYNSQLIDFNFRLPFLANLVFMLVWIIMFMIELGKSSLEEMLVYALNGICNCCIIIYA